MITVLLYGHLAKRFGRRFRLAVKSPTEAVRALCVNLPGFKQHIVQHSEPGYQVLVGKEARGENDLHHPVGDGEAIRIVPVVAGAGPVGRIIAGVVIIAALWYAPYLSSAALGSGVWSAGMGIGASLIFGGVAELLTKPPSAAEPPERPENKPSYAFDGAVNTTAQGNPVPVCYGRMIVGSQVVSAGLSVEQIAIGGSTPTAAMLLAAFHK